MPDAIQHLVHCGQVQGHAADARQAVIVQADGEQTVPEVFQPGVAGPLLVPGDLTSSGLSQLGAGKN